MSIGLPISNIVRITTALTPVAAQRRNFGNLLILGASDVIDTTERRRTYTTISQVIADFGTSAPEYQGALTFFSQTPRPQTLTIGRWAKTATKGRLNGKVLSAAEQALTNFTAITSGAFSITIDGTPVAVTALNLSGATNLNGVASLVTAKITPAVCIWNAALSRFEIRSSTTGATSAVLPVGTATPTSTALGLNTAQGAQGVAGIAAETALECAALMADQSNDWYALAFSEALTAEADIIPVAQFIEAASPVRILGHTTQDAQSLSSTDTTSVLYLLHQLGLRRTFVQYSSAAVSSPNAYAAISALARELSVNFTGNNTTITLKFKTEPGVTAETLTQSQADALASKKGNVFVNYDNDTAILQEGWMTDGTFIDEVHGLDWLTNALMTAGYNTLRGSAKVPQTNAGVTRITTAMADVLVQANTNGLIAEGVWNGDGFGQLLTGQTVPGGFYIFAPPVQSQAQEDREARKSPYIQIAVKLAGAIHSVDALVTVNR